MERIKKKRLPKILKIFLRVILMGILIIYLISGLYVGYYTQKSGEAFHGWLYYWDGPYKGKVINLDTGQPIEGAVVAGSWYLGVFLGLFPWFCDAVETTTDQNGEFVLPRAWCISLWPAAELYPGAIRVFKPGYLGYPPLGSNNKERRSYMPDWGNPRLFENTSQYNLIKLGRPKTMEERKSTLNDAEYFFAGDEAIKKMPILVRQTNRENKFFGLDERPVE